MFNWVCPNCGKDVPPSKTVCPYCPGVPEAPPAAQAYPPQGYPQQAPPQGWAPQTPPPAPPAPQGWGQPAPQAWQPPAPVQPQGWQPPPPPPAPVAAPAPPPPPPQYAPPVAPPAPAWQQTPQYPPPPAGAAWSQPPAKSGLPAWMIGVAFALVLLGIGAAIYFVFLKPSKPTTQEKAGLENPANPSQQKVSNPLQKYVEVVGIRMTTQDKKPTAKFVVVNHSSTEISGLAANVMLWASTSRSEEDSIGSFNFDLARLGPNASMELSAPLKTKLKPSTGYGRPRTNLRCLDGRTV